MFHPLGDHLLRTVAFGPRPATVLALNGWSAAWEGWQPTFEVLSASMRCLSYDTRGTGDSRMSPEAITFDALVDDVFRVLDAHRVSRCVLAGEFVELPGACHVPTVTRPEAVADVIRSFG